MGAVFAALVRGGLPPGGLWFDLCEGEGHGVRVAELRERVDPGTAGIAEAEQLGDLVEGLAGGVVDGAADEGVASKCRARGARDRGGCGRRRRRGREPTRRLRFCLPAASRLVALDA